MKTIYDLISEQNGGTPCSTPADIREDVIIGLQDQFEPGATQGDDVIAKFGSFDNFVDEVIKVLTGNLIQYDDSWENGEVYMNIEGIGQDLLDGNRFGSRQNSLAAILGTNPDGTLNRGPFF